jgi:hypothetical protein
VHVEAMNTIGRKLASENWNLQAFSMDNVVVDSNSSSQNSKDFLRRCLDAYECDEFVRLLRLTTSEVALLQILSPDAIFSMSQSVLHHESLMIQFILTAPQGPVFLNNSMSLFMIQ